MKRLVLYTVLLLIAVFVTEPALEQELIIFPAEGQSNEQMEQDKYSCYQWAKQQTGFDPMEVPKATAPPPKEEPKKGGLVGGARRQSQKREQQHKEEQWAQEQGANYQQRRNTYNRAYAACLEGKGYTVK